MLKNHYLAVFLGSGASKSAGLPLAYELRDKITSQLGLSPRPELTLEELLQQIKDRQGKDAFNIISETIEKVTIPPTGYDFLTSLVKEGFVKVIFTTNYDRLVENALSKVIGENFKVVSGLDEFENFNIEIEPKEPVIFKLHGSVEDLESMEGAWEDVQNFPVEKARVLEPYIKHYGILFVGYACADQDVKSLIERSAIQRKERRCYTVNPKAPTDAIIHFLTILESKSNHIVSTSDRFFEDLVRKLKVIQSQPAIPSELIAEKVKRMLARDSVKKALKIQLDDLRRNDLKALTSKSQSIMAQLYAMINANEGIDASYYVRDLQGSGYWNREATRTHVEQIVANSGERFLTEFEFQVRQIIDRTIIYPILFSDVDIFRDGEHALIATWMLWKFDRPNTGEILESDKLSFSWSAADTLEFLEWFKTKLDRIAFRLDEAGK